MKTFDVFVKDKLTEMDVLVKDKFTEIDVFVKDKIVEMSATVEGLFSKEIASGRSKMIINCIAKDVGAYIPASGGSASMYLDVWLQEISKIINLNVDVNMILLSNADFFGKKTAELESLDMQLSTSHPGIFYCADISAEAAMNIHTSPILELDSFYGLGNASFDTVIMTDMADGISMIKHVSVDNIVTLSPSIIPILQKKVQAESNMQLSCEASAMTIRYRELGEMDDYSLSEFDDMILEDVYRFTDIDTTFELPEDYTKVDYIEFTGAQIVDTDIIPDYNTTIEIKFTRPYEDDMYLYGVRDADSAACVTAYLTSNGAWRFGNTYKSLNVGVGDTVHSAIVDNSGIILDELQYSYNSTVNDFAAIASLILGSTRKNSGEYGDPQYIGKIYEFRMYSSGVMTADYIPSINNSGVHGFWDRISGTFKESITDTALE